MRFLLTFLAVAVIGAMALPSGQKPEVASADYCNAPAVCEAPDCRCSGTDIPGNLKPEETPQFVILTFDDAVTVTNIEFYRKALYGRMNHNQCPVAATYFVSHEYTDYTLLHELHANGHEISVHSISHEALTTYWMNASVETLTKEFAGERLIFEKFAKIPVEDIKGIRMPFLQMAGNNQFSMLKDNKFLYDLSWTTQNYVNPGMWPYTTEYRSKQDCLIGPCPDNSYPGVWVIPMINWEDEEGRVCSMVDACVSIPEDVDKIVEWMKIQFNKEYKGNRAPFGFYVHSAWFTANLNHFEAYLKFLDYLQTLPDVYMASASQVIDWVKSPKTIEQMKEPGSMVCQEIYKPACTPKACKLIKNPGNVERFMTSCVSICPKSYPWLGNPLGDD